jgi:SsrA-binding protein
MKIITQNKKAFFDYDILDRIEAGVVLTGDEVKSVKAGNVSLLGSFATIRGGELFLTNCNIKPYTQAYLKDQDAERSRKLLLHKRELNRMVGDISKKGITIIPLKIYAKKGLIKVELGIAKHKKAHSKKRELKEKTIERETRRELRGRYKF